MTRKPKRALRSEPLVPTKARPKLEPMPSQEKREA